MYAKFQYPPAALLLKGGTGQGSLDFFCQARSPSRARTGHVGRQTGRTCTCCFQAAAGTRSPFRAHRQSTETQSQEHHS
jgi:hypothetical protein